MTIDIISKRQFRKNRWLVHYSTTCSCGCTFKRGILTIDQEKEPTDEQIENKINEAHD